MTSIKRVATVAGVAAAATSLSIAAWAMTGDSHSTTKNVSASRPQSSVANAADTSATAPGEQAFAATSAKRAPGVLKAGQILKAGQYVRSPNKKYLLAQQTDGNLVLYRGKKALWSSVTGQHSGAFTAMQKDGNLVVYKGKKALWYSNTARNPGAFLAVQNDGNLVIYSKAKKALWTRNISIESLQPGYSLKTGQAVKSRNGRYTLLQQNDGNLVLYQGKKALWNTTTARHPGSYTLMQADGNLVVYSKANKPLWYSNTAGHPGAFLAVQNDGNLVIYGKNNKALWSRHLYNGILGSGQSLRAGEGVRSPNGAYSLFQQTDGNLVLYKGKEALWSTNTHGSGVYSVMQTDGNWVVYSAAGKPLWYSNTANNAGASLAVQDDGNMVIYATDHHVVWAFKK
ncbi:hypothetical protein GCM10023196_091670 [Actinoallomurus vinaceus]|uniref:Bulb-type lectin domain-containing protein n=1 Tax=Actinoallomurus vinaceus TaxID=1080074 RepID=A0ABP8UR71_9ACTN